MIAPCRRRSPLELSLGVSPRNGPSDSGRKFRTPSYFTVHDRNEVEDRRAAEIIEPIRDNVLKLRAEIMARVEERPAPRLVAGLG